MPPPTVPTAELLAESAWLRRLARRLVRDEAHAEDLVQDTLVAALEREEEGRVPGRPWLAAVLRNVARLRARSGAKRSAREAGTAAPDAPPADELVARLEAHRLLVEAVLALEEPYRSTLALRVLDGLPPRAVARRMGVPVKTVHTRTDRALARLKERLDRSFGRRDAWCAALGELARGGLALPLGLGTLGGVAMGAAIKWGSAAAVLVAGGFLVQSRWSKPGAPTAPPARAAEESRAPAALEAPLLAEGATEEGAQRTAVAPAVASAPAPVVDPAAEPATFSGRVVDEQGRPVAGVLVVFEPRASLDLLARHKWGDLARRSGTSDAEGIFSLPLQEGTGRLVAEDERWASITATPVGWMPPPEPPVVVVGPRRAYGGVVVDEEGVPVADVDLFVLLAEDVRGALGGDSAIADYPLCATSDASGRFVCQPVGFTPGARLMAASPVFESDPLPLPDGDALDLIVTVRRRLVDGAVAGRVVDARGEGVAGAYVCANVLALQTDAQGFFTLDPQGLDGSTDGANEVIAVSPGYLPARRSLEGLSNEERQELVLVLDGASSSIAGLVLDAAGEPVPEAFVWSLDSTPFGFVLERLSDADTFFALPLSLETLAAGETFAKEAFRAADAAGRFELHGLLPRAYRLCAMDPTTLAVAGPVAVDAGERNARLRLRADERAGPVAGRVTNLAGEPVEGVAVAAYRRVEDAAGALSDPPHDRAVRTRTSAEGTFRFERLVLENTHLDLRTSDGAVVHVELEREAQPEALALCVPEVRHVRVLLESEPGQAAYFAFEDAAGKTLMASVMAGTARASSDMHSFEDGSSGLVATDERARFLVLFKDGEEVRRVPLSLKRGEVNELRL